MDSNIFDKRVVRRNIEKGLITQQDYLNYLKNLQDMTGGCDSVEERLYPGDNDMDESDEDADEDLPEEQ
jgi:hypothetical protein